MNDQDVRTYEMGVRVRDFHTDNVASFPLGGLAASLFTTISTAVTTVGNAMASQSESSSDFHEGTISKAVAAETVRRSLERLRRTARSAAEAEGNEQLKAKFRIPRQPTHQTLLATARASAAEAEQMSAELETYGLPADFVDTLNEQIATFETAITRQNTGLDNQVEATQAIEEGLEVLVRAVRQVDGIVRNVFFDNPAKIAAWESARHIERAPRRKAAAADTPQP